MLHSCRMVYVSLNTAWDSLAASSYDCAHVCRHVHTHVCTPAYTRLHACLHTCLHHVTKSLIRESQAVDVEPRGDLGCAPFWRRSVAYHRRRSVAAACRLNDGGHGHRRWSIVDGYGGWDVRLAGSKAAPRNGAVPNELDPCARACRCLYTCLLCLYTCTRPTQVPGCASTEARACVWACTETS